MNKFKVGDKVRCVTDEYKIIGYTKGKTYTVTKVDSDIDNGKTRIWKTSDYGHNSFLYEKIFLRNFNLTEPMMICENADECRTGCNHYTPHKKMKGCVRGEHVCTSGYLKCIPVEEYEKKKERIWIKQSDGYYRRKDKPIFLKEDIEKCLYPKEDKMRKCIIDVFEKSQDAYLVNKYFGNILSNEGNFIVALFFKANSKEILAEAKRLEKESKKDC